MVLPPKPMIKAVQEAEGFMTGFDIVKYLLFSVLQERSGFLRKIIYGCVGSVETFLFQVLKN